MSDSEDNRPRSAHAMAPHRWRSARILEAVCQINEHLVSALTELARHGDVSATIVADNVKVLRHLDVAACKRAARIPILLLDLHFQSEDWWRDAARLNGKTSRVTASSGGLPADQIAELTRETLLIAWLAAHDSRQSTNLLFGMSSAVMTLLGQLSPQQLNRVAGRSSQELRIRWADKPDFWRRLFAAAHGGNADDLCDIHLLGLQLLGGELIIACGGASRSCEVLAAPRR
jgi:hypothetical protein